MTKIVPNYPEKNQPATEEKMVRKEIKDLKKPGQALYESGIVMLTRVQPREHYAFGCTNYGIQYDA